MSGIVAFVLDDVVHDSRVLREAASLRAAGHRMAIIGRTTSPYAARADRLQTAAGVTVVRVPVATGLLRWALMARRPRSLPAAFRQAWRHDPPRAAGALLAALALAIPAAVVVAPLTALALVLGRFPPVMAAWRGISWRLSWAFAVRPWAKAAAAAALREVPGARTFWAHDLRALPAAIAARDHAGGGTIVYDAHEIFSEAGEHARRPAWARRQIAELERRLAAEAGALVTVNQLLADRLGPGLGLPRVVVARNCPARSHQAAPVSPLRAAVRVPDGVPLLLYHGGLAPGRGIQTLARVVEQPGLEAVHLVFMGSGPSRPSVVSLAAANPRIHLLDPVDPAELLDWVAGADVVVAPIQPTTLNHRLSSPNKVFEGIAAGVPVVGSDLPGIREVILNDPAAPLGSLADPDDAAAFARAVRSILDLAPAEAAALRARCLAAAQSRWNWEVESTGLVKLAADLDPPAPSEAGTDVGAHPAANEHPSIDRQHICFVLASTGEFDARTMRLAGGLADRGHEVTIVARMGPGLPTEAAPLPGVRLVRVDAGFARARPSARSGGGSGSGRTGIPRLVGEALRIAGVIRRVRREGRGVDRLRLRPDIVHAMGFLALPVGARLAQRSGARLVYDARDLYVESNNIARLPGPLRSLFARQEGQLARAAARVFTVNESCANYLEHRYRIRRPVVVMNGQLQWSPPEPQPDRFRERLGLGPERRIVLYHGGFMRDRGLLELVEAVASTNMSDVDVVFMGSGPEEARLRDTIATLAASARMHVLPPVPPVELLDWVASADVGAMVNQPRTLNEQLSTPNKLFECLTAGTPVVSSDFPERRRIVLGDAEGPLGRLCDPTDRAAIAAAIRSILDLSTPDAAALRARCRRAGRERFGWDAQFAQALGAYTDVTGRPW